MTDILSIETLYYIGSVLLTMAVLAPILFASELGRSGAGSSLLGKGLCIGGAWRLLDTRRSDITISRHLIDPSARPLPMSYTKRGFAYRASP